MSHTNNQEQKEGIPWHRQIIGGLWEEIGQLQFDFIVDQGLKPSDYFLDVGCGSLRGGLHFIRYLDKGHYYGIDKDLKVIEAGQKIELVNANLTNKTPNLSVIEDFDFTSLNTAFNFGIAQSVFTHLYLNHIIRCVMNIEKVLAPGGKFFATLFENPDGKFNLDPIYHPTGGATTHFDKDVFHYDFGTFEHICQDTNLTVEYIGEWSHPRDQKMMVFTKR